MSWEQEVSRLKRVSERQSLMLAQALKEKNDLLCRVSDVNPFRVAELEEMLKRTRLDLRQATDELRAIKSAANQLASVLGLQ